LERLGWEGENPQTVVVPNDDDYDYTSTPFYVIMQYAGTTLPFNFTYINELITSLVIG
jgi:hypothetical protein